MTSISEHPEMAQSDCKESGFSIVSRDQLVCKTAALLKANGDAGLLVGVVIVEVNQYRRILASYGYDFAVSLSNEVLLRLRNFLPSKVTVFAIGLSEFAILLPDLRIRQQMVLAINKIKQILFKLFMIMDSSFRVKVRVGASYGAQPAVESLQLLRQADSALLHANDHLMTQCIYDEIADAEPEIPFLELQLDLERALAENELTSVFQPKVDIHTGEIFGVESLVRWTSPTYGFVQPDLIIQTAERSGLINELTLQTLNNAILQYQRWGKHAVPIAVNLSTEVISDPSLMRFIGRKNIWSMPVEALTLEITETAFMQDPDKALEVFKEFNKMGIKLSMDDFGTGYSSFEYLKNIPLQEIKIDRAFIDNMRHEDKDKKIVETVSELAKGFGCKVIAEGVEDVETYHLAMAAGCDVVQGFFISKPLTPEDFVTWSSNDAWYRPERPRPEGAPPAQ